MKYVDPKTVIPAWKEVYQDRRYFFMTGISAVILLSLNAVVKNYTVLWTNFSFSLLWSLIYGLIISFTPLALLMLIIISLLGGIVLTLSLYLVKRQLALQASLGTSGILIAIFAPACPSCALGLLGLLGISGVLAFLPFKGYELGMLGIMLLLSSVTYLSTKIMATVCEAR